MSSAAKSMFKWDADNQELAPADLEMRRQGIVQMSSFLRQPPGERKSQIRSANKPPLHALRSLGHNAVPQLLVVSGRNGAEEEDIGEIGAEFDLASQISAPVFISQ